MGQTERKVGQTKFILFIIGYHILVVVVVSKVAIFTVLERQQGDVGICDRQRETERQMDSSVMKRFCCNKVLDLRLFLDLR